jgi:carbamoyl-phosphate synthase small subunit
MSRSWDIVGLDLISDVSCKSPYEWVEKTNPEWEFKTTSSRHRESYRVIAYDFGIKQNILRRDFLTSF